MKFGILRITLVFLLASLVSSQNEIFTSLKDIIKFNKEAILAHNKYRIKHDCDELEISSDLVEIAVAEVERFAKLDKIDIKPLEYDGHNLGISHSFVKGTSYYNGYGLSRLWYNTGKNFNYEYESLQDAESFAQIIWKSTKTVGFGISRNNKTIYMIAVYYPALNLRDGIKNNLNLPDEQYNIENDIWESQLNINESEVFTRENFEKYFTEMLENETMESEKLNKDKSIYLLPNVNSYEPVLATTTKLIFQLGNTTVIAYEKQPTKTSTTTKRNNQNYLYNVLQMFKNNNLGSDDKTKNVSVSSRLISHKKVNHRL